MYAYVCTRAGVCVYVIDTHSEVNNNNDDDDDWKEFDKLISQDQKNNNKTK